MEDNRSMQIAIKCCSTLVRLHSWERQPIRAGLLPRRSERKDNVVFKPNSAATATCLTHIMSTFQCWTLQKQCAPSSTNIKTTGSSSNPPPPPILTQTYPSRTKAHYINCSGVAPGMWQRAYSIHLVLQCPRFRLRTDRIRLNYRGHSGSPCGTAASRRRFVWKRFGWLSWVQDPGSIHLGLTR